jgi:hypothetical protein
MPCHMLCATDCRDLSALADLAVASVSPGADFSKGRYIDGALRTIWRELAVSLASGNDIVMRRFLGLQARRSNVLFPPGLHVTTAEVDHV